MYACMHVIFIYSQCLQIYNFDKISIYIKLCSKAKYDETANIYLKVFVFKKMSQLKRFTILSITPLNPLAK